MRTDVDLLAARRQAREAAIEMGFGTTDMTGIVTAVSELARNILMYAERGELILRTLDGKGIEVVAHDHGPGIPDVKKALLDGYSTSGSLGLGLPGVRRLMDEFAIESALGVGTTVTVRRWLQGRAR